MRRCNSDYIHKNGFNVLHTPGSLKKLLPTGMFDTVSPVRKMISAAAIADCDRSNDAWLLYIACSVANETALAGFRLTKNTRSAPSNLISTLKILSWKRSNRHLHNVFWNLSFDYPMIICNLDQRRNRILFIVLFCYIRHYYSIHSFLWEKRSYLKVVDY